MRTILVRLRPTIVQDSGTSHIDLGSLLTLVIETVLCSLESLIHRGSRLWKKHVGIDVAVFGCPADDVGSRPAKDMVAIVSSEVERIGNDWRHASRHLEPPQTVIQEA